MKQIITIFFLILTISVWGQIPKEYEQELRREKKEGRDLEKEFDFVLDPIEQVPVIPQGYSIQAGGNWGYAFLQAGQQAEKIRSLAQRKVAVFIFDTAGDWDHPGLASFQWNIEGKIFTGESSPADGNGHSTHCAGIVGGISDQYDIGIAQELAKIGLLKGIPYKVLNNDGAGNFSWINNAIKAANARSAQLMDSGWGVVYSFSLGADGVSQPETNELLRQANELGVFVCAAAGNTGKEGIGSPANAAAAHAIGALDISGNRAAYSSFGKELFNATPGSQIMSTYPGGGYRELSGTSMATPGEAGIVSILMSCFPKATNKQISNYLQDHVTDLADPGRDKYTGWGTPLLTKLLSGNPTGSPGDDPGEDPPTENPQKSKRTITAVLEGPYTVRWKPLTDSGPFRAAFISVEVESTTRNYTEYELDRVSRLTSDFFGKYVFLLRSEDDLADAVYWAGYFYELLLNNEGNNLGIKTAIGHDEKGRTVRVDSFARLSGSLRLLFNPEIRAFQMILK